MSAGNSSGVENDSLCENARRLFEKCGCLSGTSRSSGLLVTVPELIRDVAPMRYGLIADEFYRSGTNSERALDVESEGCVPFSSLSELFVDSDDDDEIPHMSCQRESFCIRDKLSFSHNSAKSVSNENPFTSISTLDKKKGVSACRWKTSKISKGPVYEPSSSLFHDTEGECPRNGSVFSGRKVHRVIFSQVPERDLFNQKNRISGAPSAYSSISRTSNVFDRFRYQQIPRATARRFLMDRNPKYKAKYG
ncbi:unnamed protein product [Litomosoides sigmodontis]|uniref:Uncharacterized protein n=1 Tax=Litomosoides sigmodontis TaxID=42156 RepID=A0A3P6V3W4_LITSI|nr:unnamed protein product [Litomosoides sigmodontis]